MQDDYSNLEPSTNNPLEHYYGNVVRACLIAAGFVLLVTILIDRELLGFYLAIGVFMVLIIFILAALTSPKKHWVLLSETIIAGFGFVTFEYLAIVEYSYTSSFGSSVFALRQILAIIFIVTLYYGVKSLRDMKRNAKLLQ